MRSRRGGVIWKSRKPFAAGDAKDAQARLDLGTAHTEVAESPAALGDHPNAIAENQSALKILQPLVTADPTDAISICNVAIIWGRLGDVVSAAGCQSETADVYAQASAQFAALRDPAALRPEDEDKAERFAALARERRVAVCTEFGNEPR